MNESDRTLHGRFHHRRSGWLAMLAGAVTAAILLVTAYGVYWQCFEKVQTSPRKLTLYVNEEGQAIVQAADVPVNTEMEIVLTKVRDRAETPWRWEAWLSFRNTRQGRVGRRHTCDFPVGSRKADTFAIQGPEGMIPVERIVYVDEKIGAHAALAGIAAAADVAPPDATRQPRTIAFAAGAESREGGSP